MSVTTSAALLMMGVATVAMFMSTIYFSRRIRVQGRELLVLVNEREEGLMDEKKELLAEVAELRRRNLELGNTLMDIQAAQRPGQTPQIGDMTRLTLLEEFGGIDGAGLIRDDKGHWAVSCIGHQSITPGPDPADVETSFYVEKGQWQPSVREAIDLYLKECAERGMGQADEPH